MKRTISTLCLGVLLTTATLAYCDTPPTPPPASQPTTRPLAENLSDKINMTLKLLDDKKYGDVIRLLADPREVKEMEANGGFDKTVADFAAKADDLRQALKLTQGKQPALSPDGQHASFKIDLPNLPTMDFFQVDGKWYLE